MKIFKIIVALILVLVLLVGGITYYVLSNLNGIVKKVVESEGPKVTHTTVNLNEVDIQPFKGKGELKGFKIGNPAGFDSEYLLKWDSILLHLDPQSLKTDVIVIDDFGISGVNIKLEQKGKTTNVQELLKVFKSDDSSSDSSSSSSSESADVLLAMRHIKFADNTVDIITEKFGSKTVKIPSFELNNIGDPAKGLTPKQLGIAIIKPLMERAKDAAEDEIKNLTKEKLEAELEEKKAELKEKAKKEQEKAEEKLKGKEDELKSKLDEKVSEEDKEKLKKLKDMF